MPIKFIANHNTIVWGASSSGKTTFMLRVLKERQVFPFPELIYYMYRIHQSWMDDWNLDDNNPKIVFIHNLNFDQVNNENKPCILVLDDLMLATNKEMCEQFILGSHHRSISTFMLTQNLFPRDDMFRTMSQNTHYFVLLSNRRNYKQVLTLARQAFEGPTVDLVVAAYKRALSQDRGFIVLTFNPLIPSELSIVTDWWSLWPSVYLP